MEPLQNQVWVELVNNIIMARMRGDVTEEMLNQRHAQILQIANDTGCKKLLLDDLEMNAMPYEIIEAQRFLNEELNALKFRVAVVVPNSRLAYLARLQFGGENHKVFYTDIVEAINWLREYCQIWKNSETVIQMTSHNPV